MKYMKPLTLFQELTKEGKRRLLGLDVGDKYVGLSVSDHLNVIASPLSVLVRNKTRMDLITKDFQSLISEFSVSGFVVGFSLGRQSNTPDAVQVKIFISDLCRTRKLEGLMYTYWDECLTSKNAELLLKNLDLHPLTAKRITDKFAAVGILQGYLDYANRKYKL